MACRICLYVKNNALALDQGLNALIGGSPRQTISSRLGRAELAGKGWAAAFCRVLSWVFRENGHCRNAIIEDDLIGELLDLDGDGGPMSPPKPGSAP